MSDTSQAHPGVVTPPSPVLAKHRVIKDNLLQKLNELVGKVGGHEGLDGDRHFLRILGLRQGCLNNLPGDGKHYNELRSMV